jgi:flagellar protein FlbD
MILLTRLNGTPMMLNENFIEIAEEAPDTVVTLQNGHRYIVKETIEEIFLKINEYAKKTR